MKRFVIVSVILIVIYVLVKRPGLYTGLFAKVSEVAAKGVSVLTKGKTK